MSQTPEKNQQSKRAWPSPSARGLKQARLLHTVSITADPSPEPIADISARGAVIAVPVLLDNITDAAPALLKRAAPFASETGSKNGGHTDRHKDGPADNSPTPHLCSSATVPPPTSSCRCTTPFSPFPHTAAEQTQLPRTSPASAAAQHIPPPHRMHADAARMTEETAPGAALCGAPQAVRAATVHLGSAAEPNSAGNHEDSPAQGGATRASQDGTASADTLPHCSEPSTGSAMTNAPPPVDKECTPETEAACGSGAGLPSAVLRTMPRRGVAAAAAVEGTAPAGTRPLASGHPVGPVPSAVVRLNGGDPGQDDVCQGDDRPETEGAGSGSSSAAQDDQGGKGVDAVVEARDCSAAEARGGAADSAGGSVDAVARQRLLRYRALSQRKRRGNAPGSHSTTPLVRVHGRISRLRVLQWKKGRRGAPPALIMNHSPMEVLTKFVQQKMKGTRAEALAAIGAALAVGGPTEQPVAKAAAAAAHEGGQRGAHVAEDAAGGVAGSSEGGDVAAASHEAPKAATGAVVVEAVADAARAEAADTPMACKEDAAPPALLQPAAALAADARSEEAVEEKTTAAAEEAEGCAGLESTSASLVAAECEVVEHGSSTAADAAPAPEVADGCTSADHHAVDCAGAAAFTAPGPEEDVVPEAAEQPEGQAPHAPTPPAGAGRPLPHTLNTARRRAVASARARSSCVPPSCSEAVDWPTACMLCA